MAKRLGRESLQHTVAHLRSFLRFLAVRRLAPAGLAAQIDTPRVYRGERLPRSLPWEIVRAFLRAIDRSTPMGRRDYAMFLLVVTYGLRSCEVVSLRLDDFRWRDGRLLVARPKVRAPLVLPLTPEVGAAILAYLRDGRPALAHREVFLRVRAPAGTLKPTALTEAFQGWVRRAGLPIPFQGTNSPSPQQGVELLGGPDAQTDGQAGIALRKEPLNESVEVRPQQGQRRVTGVVPRVDLDKHRGLLG
jgi:integrase